MDNAFHLKTTVQPGGRIEINDTLLPSGASVDIFVLPVLPKKTSRRSAVDILASAPGQQTFKTAAEVDEYILDERNSWDR